MENFNAPYFSTSAAEFWKRWHISLSSWLKDYLYIPLGGSHKGKLRKYLNKMIVFLASGLWHGAQISFAAWGGLNGLYQVLGEIFCPVRDFAVRVLHITRNSLGHRILCIVGTFVMIDFSWIFFRASQFLAAFKIIRQMFTVKNPWILFDDSLYQCGLDAKNFRFMLLCLCVLVFADICKEKGIKIRKVIAEQDLWVRCAVVVFSVCVILTFGIWGVGYDEASFIYFQF